MLTAAVPTGAFPLRRRPGRNGAGAVPTATGPSRSGWSPWSLGGEAYSHSMVPGGLLVTSTTTRLTSRTSLVIRVEIRSSTS